MKAYLFIYQKVIFTFFVLLILTSSLQAQQKKDTTISKPAYSGSKHPGILFDEAHHNFHTSTGRYKPFADALTKDGYIITPNKQKITPEVLTGYDVFVCSNAFSSEPDSSGRLSPLLAFTAEECHYLKQWVLNGGSMWLIADHEPAGNAVENLSDSFGVNMSKSYAADPKNFDRIILDASWIRYSLESKNLGNHPIIKGRNETERIKSALSFTGQSLKGPKNSIPFLLLSDQAYDVLNIRGPFKSQNYFRKGQMSGVSYGIWKRKSCYLR